MKKFLMASLIVSLSSSGIAQNKCEVLFDESIVSVTSDGFTTENQHKEEPAKVMSLRILRMAAFSSESVFTEKYVLEKGELTLAQNLNDGWSIEGEYLADNRGASPKFRLRKFIVTKPNGDQVVIDKGPVNDDGNYLLQTQYKMDAISPFIKSTKVEFPVTVEGMVYDHTVKWASFAEYVKTQELRDLKTESDLKVLRSKVWGRSIVDYTNKVIKKQSFKFALLGLVMYLYTRKDDVTHKIFVEDPWEKLVKNGAAHNLPEREFKALVESLSSFSEKFDLKKEALQPSEKAKTKPIGFGKLVTYIEDLNRVERNISGRPVVVSVDSDSRKVHVLNYKKVSGAWADAVENANVLFVIFPATQRALLLSNDLVGADGDDDVILPIAIDGQSNPALYNYLLLQMNSVKKDSK